MRVRSNSLYDRIVEKLSSPRYNNLRKPAIFFKRTTLHTIDKFIINKKVNIDDTIAIFGSPRSGTTWLMEILVMMEDYRTVFEPFQYKWFPAVSSLKINPRPFVNENESNEPLKEYLKQIFTGQICSNDPKYRVDLNTIKNRINSKKIIVKFVRANRLITWIKNNFDLKEIILIIRNPYSTIMSQINTGRTGYSLPNVRTRGWIPIIDDILIQAELIRVEPEILSKLRKVKSNIELLSVIWCLDQYIPLKSSIKNDIEILYYEDMFRNINKITSDLITKLGYKGSKYDNSSLNIQSMTTINTLYQTEYQLNKWKDFFTEKQKMEIKKVLETFHISFVENRYEFNF